MSPSHAIVKVKRGSISISNSPTDSVIFECDTEIIPMYQNDTVVFDLERLPGPVHLSLSLPKRLQSLQADISRGPLCVTSLVAEKADLNIGAGDCQVSEVMGQWDINVGKGNLAVSRSHAEFDCNVGMGRCTLTQVRGTAHINAGLGPITGDYCEGSYDINAGKGDVQWNWGRGMVDISAGMGDVEIQQGRIDRLEINSGLGKILVEESAVTDAKLEVGIGSITVHGRVEHLSATVRNHGGINVSFPYGLGVRVEASTNHGRIISHLPLIPVGHSGPQRGERLVGMVGDGAGTISLETRRGTITLSQHADVTTPHDPDSASAEHSLPSRETDPKWAILRQLQEGHLTVEEADRLLNAVDHPGKD